MNELMLPSKSKWEEAKAQGAELIKSGFLPTSIKTPEQFMAIVLKGQELGIPPMQACAHIHIISGKPTMSAELMLAQIFKLHPKTKLVYLERTNDMCMLKISRDGGEFNTFSFSMKDAQVAGLLNNPTWKKYPRAMLHARCVSEMSRSLFPDAIAGVSYTPDELGAQVDEDGMVIDVVHNEPISRTLPSQEAQNDYQHTNQKTTTDAPVVDVPALAEDKTKMVGNATTAYPTFDVNNAEHRQAIAKFLEARQGMRYKDQLMKAMIGKEFCRVVTIEEWTRINPESPDREPEGIF